MVQESRRTGSTSPALVRLLARLTDSDVPASHESFSEPLSRWLGWTDAISLASVLNDDPAHLPGKARANAGNGVRQEDTSALTACQKDFRRVRAMLANGIAEDKLFSNPPHPPAAATTANEASIESAAPNSLRTAFAPYRRCYVGRQQAMEIAIAPLRVRLRAALAGQPQPMPRLAALDAVMEQALAAQESHLLGALPGLLEKYFGRMRAAALSIPMPTPTRSTSTPGIGPEDDSPPNPWLDTFRTDLQAVLQAELEHRLQPAEGLMEALRLSHQKVP